MITLARILLTALCLCMSLQALAAQAPARTERVPAMREPVYRQLSAAREHADRQDFAAATQALDALQAQSHLNSYERAMVWNLSAFVHYARQDYTQAANAYRKVLEQKPIPESLENATLYSLAQLLVVTEQYAKALDALNEWFARVDAPNSSAVMLLGQVHYQLGHYADARDAIERAVRETESRGEAAKESAYLLLRAIHYAQKDYPALAAVLQKLVTHYPKREYWVQLSAVYGELGDETRQLATLETAHEQGMLELESEYVMLAQLLMANGIPYKAGQVLDAGLAAGKVESTTRNRRLLADAWMLAKEYERSVEALREAAKASQDGEADLRLAQVLLEMNRYREAFAAAENALKKGELRQPATAHVVAGLALYNLDDLDAAANAFTAAARFEDAGAIVGQWREFIDKERARRAALARAASVAREPKEAGAST